MTSHLKEYPKLFAKGMAQAIFDGLKKRHHARADRRLPEASGEAKWIDDVLEMALHLSTHSFLPDFQPAAATG